MSLSSSQVAEIIRDDEEYLRHISPTTFRDQDNAKIISIPSSSFTAHRLSYVSPIELSISSKVVLLGGIPSHWVREQSKGFWRFTSRIRNRNFRAGSGISFRYGYGDLHRRHPSRRRAPDLWDSNSPGTGNYGYQGNTGTTEASRYRSTRASSLSITSGTFSKKRSYTLAVVPTRKPPPKRSDTLRRRNVRTMLKRKTVAILPSSKSEGTPVNRRSKSLHTSADSSEEISTTGSNGDSDDTSIESQEDESADAQLNSEVEGSLFHSDSPQQKSHGRGKHYSRSSQISTSVEEVSPKPEDNFKVSLADMKATNSDSLAQEPSSTVMSTAETTPISSLNQTYFPSSSAQGTGEKGSKIRFAEEGGQHFSRAYAREKRLPIVRLKPTSNSNYSEPLRIMRPEPDQPNTSSDECVYRKHFKTERLVARRVTHIGSGAKLRMRRGLNGLVGIDYSISSPSLRKLKHGRIILMEKMLVMVKSAVNKKDLVLSFSQEESIDTRVSERWKEYIVVARSTGRGDSSILLQFYRRRHIPIHVNKKKDLTYGTSLDFLLDKHCLVGLYGNLDKTIYIQRPGKKDDNELYETSSKYDDYASLKIYILKCGTLSSSGKWFNVLRGATKMRERLTQMSFKVPEADIFVDMKLRGTVVKELIDSEKGTDSLKLCILRRGYRVLHHPLMRFLTVTIFEALRKAGFPNVLQKWDLANTILGCDYKLYDMLQWCSNTSSTSFAQTFSLFKSHVLEFRPYVPPSREAFTEDGCVLIEPPSVEGFLIRLTNRFGREGTRLRKLYFRPSYFFTNDNLLFFMTSLKATPPSPSIELDLNSLLKEGKLGSLPDVYEQEPYPIDLGSHISWLKGESSTEDFKLNDIYALKCYSRRVDQILKAEGVIDLCDIEEIYQGTPSDVKGSEIKYRVLHYARGSFWHSKGDDVDSTAASIIYIVTRKNLVLKLMASDSRVSQEWVLRLKSLVSYWKVKKACDEKKMWNLKVKNMHQLKITNEQDSNINDGSPKWIMDRGFTDTSLYNVNALCGLRPIIHTGMLYQKPKKHSTFTKYLVVLVPGFLIIYKPFKKSATGFSRDVVNFKHYLTISIAECYLYSGSTSKLDLLNRRNKIEELTPLTKALPRVYPDDWRSLECESARCFTLWFGKKRAMLAAQGRKESISDDQKKSKKKDNLRDFESNPNMFRMVNRLGVSGKSMVFMARSRQERNMWVLAISTEIEKLRKSPTVTK